MFKLNVGGNEVRDGGFESELLTDYINIDVQQMARVQVVCNVVNGLPFDDVSCCVVRCSHMSEHLKYDDILKVLKEFNRVLGQGGMLRVYVPDARKITEDWLRGDITAKRCNYYLLGKQENEFGLHRYLFNLDELNRLVVLSGFMILGNQPRHNAYKYDLGVQATKIA